MSAHKLVAELDTTLKKYDADLTYTTHDDGVHIIVDEKTVARREFDKWVVEDVDFTVKATEEPNPITLVNGSKYSYTVQEGELLVSYGFDTFEELSDCVISDRNKGDQDRTLTV